jgi:Ca2+:H+ antiporter
MPPRNSNPMAVNSFRIKRAAHNLSRADSGWNPFGHTFRSQASPRSGTWHGASQDVEAQRSGARGRLDLALTQTAPAAPGSRGTEHDDEKPNMPSSSKDKESQDTVTSKPSTAGTATDAQDGMRLRTTSRDVKPTPQVDDDNNAKSKKDTGKSWYKEVHPTEPFTVGNQVRRALFGSWVNILLLAAPAGIALGFIPNANGIAMFVVNFVAIVPLAALLSFATEEIALRTGETLGGLLNASFGYVSASCHCPISPIPFFFFSSCCFFILLFSPLPLFLVLHVRAQLELGGSRCSVASWQIGSRPLSICFPL